MPEHIRRGASDPLILRSADPLILRPQRGNEPSRPALPMSAPSLASTLWPTSTREGGHAGDRQIAPATPGNPGG